MRRGSNYILMGESWWIKGSQVYAGFLWFQYGIYINWVYFYFCIGRIKASSTGYFSSKRFMFIKKKKWQQHYYIRQLTLHLNRRIWYYLLYESSSFAVCRLWYLLILYDLFPGGGGNPFRDSLTGIPAGD
uniref:Uncharacterized protein n=1 Tax=Ophiognomonia clavigignenti-juglandacearum TaxID=218668 RepID=A0A291LJ74_9PEZI|nr:hypothetical protein [Ophiognomonia clavigignenti-juglandacearum]